MPRIDLALIPCLATGSTLGFFIGHAKVTTTLSIYAHLFEDDHADAMAALDAMTSPTPNANNVVRLQG
jgi:hypothetical protein